MQTKYRMYGFCPMHLSGIQKGIQFGHAVVDYISRFGYESDVQQWALNDKTFIILDGFSSVNMRENIIPKLVELGFKYMEFREPDLDNLLTAIVFLVPDTIYDYQYPDPSLLVDITIPKEVEWLRQFRLASN